MSAVIGLTEEEGAESFLAALETGLTSEEQKKDKSTMPGMGENPFDKVFLVAPAGTEAALAERLTEKARYHFDAVFCPTLAEAVEQAKANSRRGLLVCGGCWHEPTPQLRQCWCTSRHQNDTLPFRSNGPSSRHRRLPG